MNEQQGLSRIRRAHIVVSGALAIALATACAGSAAPVATPPPNAYTENGVSTMVDRTTATDVLENSLRSFKAGDYSGYTRDWSDTMKAAIKEPMFMDVRSQVTAAVGQYVSIDRIDLVPSPKAGYVRWVASATFEKTPLVFWVSFTVDGTKIEGANFEQPR